MLARIRKAQEEEGFTLIELLVVMIIIGILAAIAIPVFLSQRAKAQDSAAKADVSTIGKELASYYVDNADDSTLVVAKAGTDPTARYTLKGVATRDTAGVLGNAQDLGKASTNVVLDGTTTAVSATAWCVSVTNAKGDKAKAGYKYSALGGLAEGKC